MYRPPPDLPPVTVNGAAVNTSPVLELHDPINDAQVDAVAAQVKAEMSAMRDLLRTTVEVEHRVNQLQGVSSAAITELRNKLGRSAQDRLLMMEAKDAEISEVREQLNLLRLTSGSDHNTVKNERDRLMAETAELKRVIEGHVQDKMKIKSECTDLKSQLSSHIVTVRGHQSDDVRYHLALYVDMLEGVENCLNCVSDVESKHKRARR